MSKKEKKKYIKVERDYAPYCILPPEQVGEYIQAEVDNNPDLELVFTTSPIELSDRQYANLPELEE